MTGPKELRERSPWDQSERRVFLELTDRHTAEYISHQLLRSKPAIQGMRRKLKRLRELGVTDPWELKALLAVHEAIVLVGSLREIRDRAALDLVPVKRFVRRSRVTGKPHLVSPHKRNRSDP
jgi:hypothetical protein